MIGLSSSSFFIFLFWIGLVFKYLTSYIDANVASGMMVRALGQQDFACKVSCVQITFLSLISVLVSISLSTALGT